MEVILIRGQKWTVHLQSNEAFDAQHDGEDRGATLISDKAIYFNLDFLDIKVVRHELVHAYFSTLYVESADLTIEQYEEILAEFLEDYLPVIHAHSKKLFKRLTSIS